MERRNNERSQKDFKLRFGIFKTSSLKIGGCVKFDMYRAKLKGESYLFVYLSYVSLSLEKDACT